MVIWSQILRSFAHPRRPSTR